MATISFQQSPLFIPVYFSVTWNNRISIFILILYAPDEGMLPFSNQIMWIVIWIRVFITRPNLHLPIISTRQTVDKLAIHKFSYMTHTGHSISLTWFGSMFQKSRCTWCHCSFGKANFNVFSDVYSRNLHQIKPTSPHNLNKLYYFHSILWMTVSYTINANKSRVIYVSVSFRIVALRRFS